MISPKSLSLTILLLIIQYSNSLCADSLYTFACMKGENAGRDFFHVVKGIGDINNDGYDDVIVGAAYRFPDKHPGNYAKVYFGGAVFDTVADLTFRYPGSEFPNCSFGYAITSGDYNGDGFRDIAIGAPFYGIFEYGIVYIYYGGSQMDTTADRTITDFVPYYRLGYSLATGDVNGDGTDDLIVGSPFDDVAATGRIYIYFGGKNFGDRYGAKIDGKNYPEFFAQSISIAGDINKDGCMDILAGAPTANNFPGLIGKAYLIYGNKENKLDSIIEIKGDTTVFNQMFGIFTSGLGDVNKDGYDDFAVMAYEYLKIYSGKTLEVLKKINSPRNLRRFTALYGGTDINGDGYSDIFVGVENEAGLFKGTMNIFLGGNDIDTIPAYTNNGRKQLEYFADKIDCAGDVNGDGFKDMIVGSLGSDSYYFSEGGAALLSLNRSLVNVNEDKTEIKDYKLYQNYPNPFNPATTISYSLPNTSHVTLTLYNILGSKIAILIDKEEISGNHSFKFDSSKYNLSNGIYLLSFSASNHIQSYHQSIKILLIK